MAVTTLIRNADSVIAIYLSRFAGEVETRKRRG